VATNFYLPWSIRTYASAYAPEIACTILNSQGNLIASVPDYKVAEHIVEAQTEIERLEKKIEELEIDLDKAEEDAI